MLPFQGSLYRGPGPVLTYYTEDVFQLHAAACV